MNSSTRKTALIAILALTLGIAISASWLVSTARASDAPTGSKVLILVYHSVRPYYPGITDFVKEYTVPPDIFDDQMKYMRDNGFTPVSMDALDSALVTGAPLPPKPFLVTFDDGWRNQFSYAYPIVEKYHYPALFYIYSNVIGAKAFMTWDNVRQIATSSMYIGGHSENHPELPKVAQDATLNMEVAGGKQAIEAKLGMPIADFAYPYGEYDDRVVQSVKNAGYRTARALVSCAKPETVGDIYTLCGIIVTGDFNRFVSLVNK